MKNFTKRYSDSITTFTLKDCINKNWEVTACLNMMNWYSSKELSCLYKTVNIRRKVLM